MRALTVGLATGVAAKTYFKEDFNGDLSKWTQSEWKESDKMGKFELKKATFALDEKDTSLATTTDHRFYGISTNFDTFSNDEKDLIVQFQVKYDKDIECGGGYLKLGPKIEDLTKFGDPTPYNIMFGPDKCGYTKRTHLIFNYNGKNILKTVDLPYKQDTDMVSNLYRLVLKSDNTVKVFVDKKEVYSGSLESDWKLLPEKEITDPDDKKPEDWVDEAMMDDPEDKKPADWVDEKKIVDKDAKKPDDWDEEEDGEWEAPQIDNPDFKGEWKPKRISNPAYKGVWAAKKIPNPEYEANDKLYKYDEFGFVGFDLWQVKAASFFDNLIIADDEVEADKWADEWEKLQAHEKKEKESTTTTTTTISSADSDLDVDKDEEEDL